jgi:hypothetical protein
MLKRFGKRTTTNPFELVPDEVPAAMVRHGSFL